MVFLVPNLQTDLEFMMDELIFDPTMSRNWKSWQSRAASIFFIALAGVVVWMVWSQFSWLLASLGKTNFVTEMDQTAFTEETGVRITRVSVSAGVA